MAARLPAGKTLATFDFESVPMLSKAQAMALAAGDALKAGANLLLFGPPESDSYCPSRYPLRVQVLFDPDRQTMAAGTAAHARRA